MGSPVYKPQQTKLDMVLEQKFYERYGGIGKPGWFLDYVRDNNEGGRMAGLLWHVYQQAFYDGFVAKLSGVQDERETTDTAPASQA